MALSVINGCRGSTHRANAGCRLREKKMPPVRFSGAVSDMPIREMFIALLSPSLPKLSLLKIPIPLR